MIYTKEKERGYVALISVLIVSALTLAISIGVSSRAINGAYMNLGAKQSYEARSLALSCGDVALLRLRDDSSYVGNEDVSLGEAGTCHVYPISGGGADDRTVTTQASVGGFVKKMEISVASTSPSIHITSWKEVVDF